MNDDFYSSLLTEKIREAEAGDTQAAYWLLHEFCGAAEQLTSKDGTPLRLPSGIPSVIPYELSRYLAACFRKVLADVPADKALGITTGEPGAPRKGQMALSQRNFELCSRILDLQRDGMSIKDAIDRIASQAGVSVSTVKKAWEDVNAKISANLTERLNEHPK